MNIRAVSPAYDVYPSTSTNPTNKSAASPNTASADGMADFLTPNDISTLERLYGKSSLADLEADPSGLDGVKWINNIRQNGIQGDIATFVPAANLTASDASLLEKMTGTSTIAAAMASNSDAVSFAIGVSMDRQNGSLVGDVSTDYLQNLFSASSQLETVGQSGHMASSAFLSQAIDDVESAVGQPSGSVVDTTV